ncbi:MAG: hypothetical protein OER95_00585 [Acidimicrobiia bacterium]|nr:hypothetical protein [Acidimicrobiia bacterium]
MAAALALALMLVTAPAAPASAETTAEVESTVGGFYRPGATTVLLVTVTADQAVTGTIRVSDESGESTTEREIEVPGGSAKTFAVPVTVAPWGGRPVVVVETSDGQTRRPGVNLQQVGDVEPVAVMPSLNVPGLVERADLAVDLGQARMVLFDPAHLDHGAAALSAATAVVATEADVDDLSESQRRALFGWVSSGGNLYLDGSLAAIQAGVIGAMVEAGGGRFAPSAGAASAGEGRAWLGAGSVHVVGDSLSSGRYDGLVKPRFSQDFFDEGQFVDPGDVLSDLSYDAGFRTRPIGPFIAVLLVYIAVIGPILWLYLSRTRREPLLWLAVPALAAVVSIGIWGSGRFFRQGTSGSHVTVIGTSGTGSQSLSDYMISSSGGGFTGIELADGWEPATSGFNSWDWRFREAGFAQPTVQGNRIGADVPPAGVVVARASSDGAVANSWTVNLTVNGNSIVGTVTNTTPYDLVEVVVFSGDQIRRLDSVDSGAGADFELNDVAMPALWDDPVQRRLSAGGGRDSASSPAALQRWMSASGLQSRAGQITVIGWSTDPPAPLEAIGGRSVDKGRTGFVSSFPVAQLDDSGSIGGPSIRSRIVDLRWSEEFGAGGLVALDRRVALEGDVQTIIYDLPPGAAAGDDLVVDVPGGVSAMDIWVVDGWTDAGIGRAPAGDVLLKIPPGALIDGTVYLRVLLGPPERSPLIRSATSSELSDAISVPGRAEGGRAEGGQAGEEGEG